MRSHSDKSHKGKEVYPVNYPFCPALGVGESIDQAAGGVMQRGSLQLRYKVAERVSDKSVKFWPTFCQILCTGSKKCLMDS